MLNSDYHIEKTWEGIRAYTPTLTGELKTDFRYAMVSFSYLVDNGERLSIEDFRWRITRHCSPSDRLIVALQALDKVRALETVKG